jgi:excisionase family DNA binding protein
MTVREFQQIYDVSDVLVLGLIKTGQLEAVKIGKVWRILRSSVDAYIEAHRIPQTLDPETGNRDDNG